MVLGQGPIHRIPDTPGREPEANGEGPRIQLRLAKPRAISLRRTQVQGGPLPADLEAPAGALMPLLIVHHVAAYAPHGQVPPRTFGLGYACVAQGVDAQTVALAPSSQHQEVVHAGGPLHLGVDARGALDLELGGQTHRMLDRLGDVAIETDGDGSLHVELQCGWTRMTVQGSAEEAGGARWTLYGRRRDLREAQALVHTLLVPAGVRSLRVGVTAWAMHRAPWLGPRAARSWATVEQTWDLSLDGL